MIKAIIDLENLFKEAKAANEFEFVMTLLNYKSIGAQEIQANLHEWFDAITMYKGLYQQYGGKEKTRMGAMLYSTFFENSDFYNIIGNLCRAVLGMRATSYLFWKTKKYERLLGIGEKQDFLIELLTDTGKTHIIDFFEQNHYPSIRNTFFHSAYSMDDNEYILHDSEIQIGGVIRGSFEINAFFYPLVNNVIAFFDAFYNTYVDHFNSYKEDKPIANTPLGPKGVIIGTPDGLGGMRFFKTVSFFGQWHDSGFWFDEKFGIFGAHNINLDFSSVEQIEIDEQLTFYEKKVDVRISDEAFFNLVDKISERRHTNELQRAVQVLISVGKAKESAMDGEANEFKKKSYVGPILKFYRRALELAAGWTDTTALVIKIKSLEAMLEGRKSTL